MNTRFQNHSQAIDHQHCPWCCDQGLLPVGTEPSVYMHKAEKRTIHVEQYGPCPNCEIGLAMEQAHWKRGYWQGRDISHIEKQCRCGQEANTAESRAAWEKAKEFLNNGLKETVPASQWPGGGEAEQPRGASPPDRLGGVPPGSTPEPEPSHHRCETYEGQDMPWPQSTCEGCNPKFPDEEEMTL